MNLLPLNNKNALEILCFGLANAIAVQIHNSASHPIFVGDDIF